MDLHFFKYSILVNFPRRNFTHANTVNISREIFHHTLKRTRGQALVELQGNYPLYIFCAFTLREESYRNSVMDYHTENKRRAICVLVTVNDL